MHNVVECPWTQIRYQGSCFQINTLIKKKSWVVNNALSVVPLCCLLDSFQTLLFSLTRGSAWFLYTYMYFPTSGGNKFYIICFKSVTSSLRWILKINSISVLLCLDCVFLILWHLFTRATDFVLWTGVYKCPFIFSLNRNVVFNL